jgi:hypothetical protein
LADCLRGVAPAGRLALLTLYWRTREQAARYQVLNERLEQLDALTAVVIASRNEPGMAEAGVRLQAARRTAKGAALEAQLALVQGEFDLTQAAGRRLEEAWLLPATPPQSGRYVVAAEGALSGAAQRGAEMIGLRHGELELRADAVIRSDELRATLGAGARGAVDADTPAGSMPLELSALDQVVWAVARQAEHTLEFLSGLTEYNVAIARYVLATAPPGVAADELLKRLVIARTARGES